MKVVRPHACISNRADQEVQHVDVVDAVLEQRSRSAFEASLRQSMRSSSDGMNWSSRNTRHHTTDFFSAINSRAIK